MFVLNNVNQMTNYPLVSIVVVTYNSSKHVLETLESVKDQTYPNLELIITDDCSTDNTVEICSEWLEKNQTRFNGVQLITSGINTGITANRNRGNFAATGEWIKHVDGDDRLHPSCVKDYVKYVSVNPTKNMVFSPLSVLGEGDLERWRTLLHSNFEYAFSLSPRDFKILLCKICLFPAPSLFINAEYFRQVGGYDESIRDLEDWPFWVKTAFNGAQFGYIDTPEVDYRISTSSLSQSVGGVSPRYQEALRQVEKKTIGYMRKISCLYALDGFLAYKNKYERNPFWILLSYIRLLNPYFWKARRLYSNYKMFNL